MLPFSPLLISNALLEGMRGVSSLFLEGDKKAGNALKKFFFAQFDFLDKQKNVFNSVDKDTLVISYEAKKEALHELLRQADTGSIDYKRFSFIIQLLWDFMNPKLNPFFYEDGTLEKGTAAFLLSMGITKPAAEHEGWGYRVGENLAAADGYVIFENEVLQPFTPTRSGSLNMNRSKRFL